jgi:hypothetical protein
VSASTNQAQTALRAAETPKRRVVVHAAQRHRKNRDENGVL